MIQVLLCPRCQFLLGAYFAWLANSGAVGAECRCPQCKVDIVIDFERWTVRTKGQRSTKRKQLGLDL